MKTTNQILNVFFERHQEQPGFAACSPRELGLLADEPQQSYKTLNNLAASQIFTGEYEFSNQKSYQAFSQALKLFGIKNRVSTRVEGSTVFYIATILDSPLEE